VELLKTANMGDNGNANDAAAALQAKQEAFLRRIVAIIESNKNAVSADFSADDLFMNFENNLSYQGFDPKHMRSITVTKYAEGEDQLHLRHLAIICGVFYKWGNVHNSRMKNMTVLLQTRLTGALQKLGIALRGGSGYTKATGKDDLNLPRIAAAWPEITAGLIHQGLMTSRSVTSQFNVDKLPPVMRFQHFMSLMPKTTPHYDTLQLASFAYPCMIDRIINQKNLSKFKKIRQYHELTCSHVVLTKAKAIEFLIKHEVVTNEAENPLADSVIQLAEHMKTFWFSEN